MKTISLILLILLVVSVLILYFLYKSYKKIKAENKDLIDKYSGLSQEFQKLLETNQIKKENKESADEKINNLHNGNVVDNAINILRK